MQTSNGTKYKIEVCEVNKRPHVQLDVSASVTVCDRLFDLLVTSTVLIRDIDNTICLSELGRWLVTVTAPRDYL
jgi:hypothetical protein